MGCPGMPPRSLVGLGVDICSEKGGGVPCGSWCCCCRAPAALVGVL